MRRGELSRRQQARETAAEPRIRTARKWPDPVRAISDAGIERVHEASTRLLAEQGIAFMAPEAWDILARHDVRIDRETGVCQFPREVVETWVAKAPSQFRIEARDPALTLEIGGSECYFAFGMSAPFVIDTTTSRRAGNTPDFQRLIRLADGLDTAATIGAYSSEPIDRPVPTRHLDCIQDYLTMTDKTFRVYPIGRTRAEDALDMVAIAHGIDRDELAQPPRMWSILSVNSPLKLDDELLRGAIVMAEAGQAQVVSPVCFAGAMAPVTMSGALVQANAEALATIAFLQMVRPGAPVFYGDIVSPVDMRSGAPQTGAAETHLATLAASQLARHYGIPRRTTNGCNACNVDAQAGYETALSLMMIYLSGSDLVFAAHGMTESLLLFSYEKAVMDHEVIRMICRMSGGLDLSDIDEALGAMAAAGPGGHFFDTSHTLSRYDSAVMEPLLSNWSSYEAWELDGSVDATARARGLWQDIVQRYEAPAIAPDRKEALAEFVERRRREILKSA